MPVLTQLQLGCEPARLDSKLFTLNSLQSKSRCAASQISSACKETKGWRIPPEMLELLIKCHFQRWKRDRRFEISHIPFLQHTSWDTDCIKVRQSFGTIESKSVYTTDYSDYNRLEEGVEDIGKPKYDIFAPACQISSVCIQPFGAIIYHGILVGDGELEQYTTFFHSSRAEL